MNSIIGTKNILKTLQQNLLIKDQNIDFDVFAPVPKINIVSETSTGGHKIQLGNFKQLYADFEIWIDEYTGRQKLWYGLNFRRNPKLSSDFIDKYDSKYVISNQYSGDDLISQNLNGWEYYILPLANSKIGKIIFEGYSISWYLGMYDNIPENSSEIGIVQQNIKRIFDQFYEIEESLNPNIYSGIENRLLVQTHLRRERNGRISRERKKADLYICQICGFDFEKVYGKYGESFAEAHHKVALGSSNSSRITTLKDLITVCSNCHRMLHRMEGKENDYLKLKAIVARNRK